MIKDTIKIQNGVYIGCPINSSFSDAYLKVRDLEGRVYSDELVSQLPYMPKNHVQYNEWKLRQKSTNRFVDYLSFISINSIQAPLRMTAKNASLLEIGCGNGWFTAQCSKYVKNAIGVDINLQELEQGARVFKQPNLHFLYWDIFTETPFTQKFDIIVLNAVVQYFQDFEKLKERLFELLSSNGEIHIIDSPFYQKNEVELAQQRTKDYYSKTGVEEMIGEYHHHTFDAIKDFEVLYQPTNSRIAKLIKGKDMPFGWYRLSR